MCGEKRRYTSTVLRASVRYVRRCNGSCDVTWYGMCTIAAFFEHEALSDCYSDIVKKIPSWGIVLESLTLSRRDSKGTREDALDAQ